MCYQTTSDRPNNAAEYFAGVWGSSMYYLEQLAEGAWLKAIFATLTAFFIEYLHGDVQVLYIYLGMSAADLHFGRKLAKRLGTYDPRKMKYWLRKQMTHFMLVLIAGALAHQAFRTEGFDFSVVNWVLMFLTYVEAASIEDKLKTLGYPIHPVIHRVFALMRRKAVHDFSKLIDDPELREELEKALESKRSQEIQE